MPIYEYRCQEGHTFEVKQRMTDDPLASCQTCEAPVQRVFHPIAVHFKGSGFYNTDYGTRKRSRENESRKEEGSSKGEGSSGSDAKSGSDTKSGSDAKSGSESKPEKKASTPASSSSG